MSRKYWSLSTILVIAIVFFITTGLLFGGGFLYEKIFRRNPLQKWVRTNPAVIDFQLQEQREGLSLELKLDPDQVENLQTLLEPFLREVLARKGKAVTEVRIVNEPSPALRDIYYQLSFALEEAKATGEYNTLYQVLQGLQAKTGEADFRVYLGTDFLYVQLRQGKDSLYAVLPRKAEGIKGLAAAGGAKGGEG
ncbi:MAG TPA: hypothetical protein GXZ98_03700 [Firmicutes bacterium]|jgi:hypothetical protein|nr:hypothetical protein [Bacillota bacterium]